LIKSGDISVEFEISNLRAHKDINVHIRTYLEKSDHYKEVRKHIIQVTKELQKTESPVNRLHLNQKLQNLYKIETDLISNTLYLAETLSKIEPRTDNLKRALELFEQAEIKEADAILNEADLLNDQFNLIAFVEYQEKKSK